MNNLLRYWPHRCGQACGLPAAFKPAVPAGLVATVLHLACGLLNRFERSRKPA